MAQVWEKGVFLRNTKFTFMTICLGPLARTLRVRTRLSCACSFVALLSSPGFRLRLAMAGQDGGTSRGGEPCGKRSAAPRESNSEEEEGQSKIQYEKLKREPGNDAMWQTVTDQE